MKENSALCPQHVRVVSASVHPCGPQHDRLTHLQGQPRDSSWQAESRNIIDVDNHTEGEAGTAPAGIDRTTSHRVDVAPARVARERTRHTEVNVITLNGAPGHPPRSPVFRSNRVERR